MLLVFMVGVALAAIFTIVEYRWLSKDFFDVRKLKIAYKMKAIIAGILILLAIAFAIALFKSKDVGAVLEWAISFGYVFFLLTFYYDLRQAKGAYRGRYAPEPHHDMHDNHSGHSTSGFANSGAYANGQSQNANMVQGQAPTYPSAAYGGHQPHGNGAGGHYPNEYQANAYPATSQPMRQV